MYVYCVLEFRIDVVFARIQLEQNLLHRVCELLFAIIPLAPYFALLNLFSQSKGRLGHVFYSN